MRSFASPTADLHTIALLLQVLFKHHDPLVFSLDQLRDFLEVSAGWFAASHAAHPDAHHAFFLWNCLARAGGRIRGGASGEGAAGMEGAIKRWAEGGLHARSPDATSVPFQQVPPSIMATGS